MQYFDARLPGEQNLKVTLQESHSHFVHCLFGLVLIFQSIDIHYILLLILVSFSNLIKRHQHLLTVFLFQCVVLKHMNENI